MRRICVVLIACIMVFGLSACGSNQSGTEVESKYTADTSFLDDVYNMLFCISFKSILISPDIQILPLG